MASICKFRIGATPPGESVPGFELRIQDSEPQVTVWIAFIPILSEENPL